MVIHCIILDISINMYQLIIIHRDLCWAWIVEHSNRVIQATRLSLRIRWVWVRLWKIQRLSCYANQGWSIGNNKDEANLRSTGLTMMADLHRVHSCNFLSQSTSRNSFTGCWFGTFFIFHNIWDNPSHWLSYFSEGLKPPTRWVWVNTYRYIFSGMNIHLQAILGFTSYQGFDPSPDDHWWNHMKSPLLLVS